MHVVISKRYRSAYSKSVTLSHWVALLLFCCTGLFSPAWAQQQKGLPKRTIRKPQLVIERDTVRYQKLPYDTVTYEKGGKVQLLGGANRLIVMRTDTTQLVKLIGKGIHFQQDDVHLWCDSAYKFEDKNLIEAFGQVRVVQSDTITLTCRRLLYDGNSRMIQAREQVVLRDPQMTLTTNFLDYNLNAKIGYYYNGGEIRDTQNHLKSRSGSYDANARFFFFKDEVRVISRQGSDTYQIQSDTLQYNTLSKIAYFKGPTTVSSTDGKIYAENGIYETLTKVSRFSRRAMVDNREYTLQGDSLYFDDIRKEGFAKGKAEMYVKQDSTFINGDIAWFWGKQGLTHVYRNAFIRNIQGGDTLFISADTLISYNRPLDTPGKTATTDTTKRKILAFHAIKIYRSDLQGICDSLVYHLTDSTIYMYRKPIIWNQGNQIVADSMRLRLAENRPYRMELRQNVFIASQDSLGNFNQLKGREGNGYFRNGVLDCFDMDGNTEVIFFQLEGDTILTGMYYAECASLKAFLKENQLERIRLEGDVNGKMMPPHLLQDSERYLDGFQWLGHLRPQRSTVLVREPGRAITRQMEPAPSHSLPSEVQLSQPESLPKPDAFRLKARPEPSPQLK